MGSTRAEVEVSYDVSNDFFRLWLDERMNYTSAVFESDDQSLEAAQLNKLRILSDFAAVSTGKSVLDIGCGWGAALEYVVSARGAKRAVGVTLSTAQAQEVRRREIPGVECIGADFMQWNTEERFDSVLSICMMDHLCSPSEARHGRAVDVYRAYFRKVHELTNRGARFGLQTILRNRTPRPSPWGPLPAGTRQDLEDLHFSATDIFPGGLNPRLEEIVQAVNPYWEVLRVVTRREHYARTTGEWLRRLRQSEAVIRSTWGDKVFGDYERYLSGCVRAFERHYSSLAQYELRRID